MSWWKRKKCASCRKVLKPKHGCHELRLGTADGIINLEVCDDCARFWDASAEVLTGKSKEDNENESI